MLQTEHKIVKTKEQTQHCLPTLRFGQDIENLIDVVRTMNQNHVGKWL